MNFRYLEYLVAVARLSHFGRAAEECHVSQSALSLQLQKLERELGVQLLERTSRKVVVTEIGEEVVRRAG
jgi:LysR family hydrogen peroxide-inducible transcriptional activator